jgi:DNA-binding NtrC family response regulator
MDNVENAPTVLLVEDEELIRTALVVSLQDAGVDVRVADNADAAMDALTEDKNISAVISDVKMPGSTDGVGLAKWMREHVPAVPLILVSGYPFEAELWAVNPAIAIIVKKPYDPDEVVGWVKSLVDKPEGSRA